VHSEKRLNKARRTYRHPKPDQGSTKVSTLTGFFFGGGRGKRALFIHFFPMDAHAFVSALLDCGYLDTDYLFRLTDAYGIEPCELMDDVHELVT
jgi:hypothetical protein